MVMNVWEKGDKVRMPVTFDNGGTPPVLTDPTNVTFKLFQPNGVMVVYVYGIDIQVVKDSTGKYHVDFIPTMSGQHDYHWSGSGQVDRSKTGSFTVLYTNF